MFRRGRPPRNFHCDYRFLGNLHRIAGERECRAETSRSTPTSKIGKQSISSKATKAAAFRKRKLNAAPGPPSTKTTAAESNLADRDAANPQAILPRTRAGEWAAPHRRRGRRQADRRQPKKP